MNTQSTSDSDHNPQRQREIKSFVIRSGRMTDSQHKAFKQHMTRWSLSPEGSKLNKQSVFGNQNPLVLEIGFGMGDSLAAMAANEPKQNYIGVEVHQAGVGRLLRLVEEKQLHNVRVYCHDAVEILKKNIAEQSLDRINIFFPDPWHKKKHHKRRLIKHDFLTLVYSRVVPGGLLHIATDWKPYAEHVLETIAGHPFENIAGEKLYTPAAELGRPETKFERRGVKLGHDVWDMAFRALSPDAY